MSLKNKSFAEFLKLAFVLSCRNSSFRPVSSARHEVLVGHSKRRSVLIYDRFFFALLSF